MSRTGAKPTIESTAQLLRSLTLKAKPGTALGNEEALIAKLGVSRATLRQVARILEREGLLLVKRGIQGGYFAARPDLNTIENSVTAYLEMLDTDVRETTVVGSALWVEVLKLAAGTPEETSRDTVNSLRDAVSALKLSAKFDDVLQLEQECRSAIFTLINARYIELIFQINLIFSRRKFPINPGELDDTPYQEKFVRAWRNAKLIELDSIEMGDPELAALAARQSRKLWYQRIWGDSHEAGV